jgi:hypothetical protein
MHAGFLNSSLELQISIGMLRLMFSGYAELVGSPTCNQVLRVDIPGG